MRLRKRVDQALIPISTIQKFPALFFYPLWFFGKNDLHFSCFREIMEKFTEIKPFLVRNTFLIKLRPEGYQCKSGIAIFAWKVTSSFQWNLQVTAHPRIKERSLIISFLSPSLAILNIHNTDKYQKIKII